MSYMSEADALEDPKEHKRGKNGNSEKGKNAKSGKNGKSTASAEARSGAQTHAHIMPDRVWIVLARRAYDEPLRQIGTVEADDSDLAQVYARSIYDEFAWVEMAVLPREMLVTVIAS